MVSASNSAQSGTTTSIDSLRARSANAPGGHHWTSTEACRVPGIRAVSSLQLCWLEDRSVPNSTRTCGTPWAGPAGRVPAVRVIAATPGCDLESSFSCRERPGKIAVTRRLVLDAPDEACMGLG